MTDRPLREMVHADIVGVRPDDDMGKVLRLMRKRRISCVVALTEGRPVGIVTERTVLLAAADRAENLAGLAVGEIMSSPVTTIGWDSSAMDAHNLITTRRLRHLVVVDEAGLARGVLTRSDILRGLESRRTRDLSRKARELAQANTRLRSLDEIKSSFLSSVSHELRTPLTSLLGFAKLISKDFSRSFMPLAANPDQTAKAERISRNLDIIVQEGERLTRLINDFLDLSKIEAGRMDWNDREVAVADCVQRAVGAVRWAFEANPDVVLDVALPESLPPLRMDPDRLEQVLLNLLDNAAKYTGQGRVELRVEAEGDSRIRFTVSDTGPGIEADELAGVFDKFRRAGGGDTVPDRPKGTGLGLSICKEIVEHYGGDIRAEAEPGRGSRFHFSLPVAPHACNRTPVVTGEDGRPLILVVDDDPAVCSYLIQFFENEGYRVAAARDGASALNASKELAPDLVTMDLVMPDMDGRQAIAAMRRVPELAAIPVLVISVLAQDGFKPDHAQAVLEKPIDEHRLAETVTALLTDRRRKRLIPVLRRHFPSKNRQFFTLLMGDVAQCDEQGLWERLESGFEGTVILPDWAAESMDMDRLKANPGVHILVMPEDAGPEA